MNIEKIMRETGAHFVAVKRFPETGPRIDRYEVKAWFFIEKLGRYEFKMIVDPVLVQSENSAATGYVTRVFRNHLKVLLNNHRKELDGK